MTTTRVCGERPRGTPTARGGEATRATTLARFSPDIYLFDWKSARVRVRPTRIPIGRTSRLERRVFSVPRRARATPRRTHARVARQHANPHRCAHTTSLSTARVSSRLDPAALDGASIARARMSLGTARAPAAPRPSRGGSRCPSTRSTRLPSNRASPLPPFRPSSRPRARRRERRPRPDRNTLPPRALTSPPASRAMDRFPSQSWRTGGTAFRRARRRLRRPPGWCPCAPSSRRR